ncbi:MAG: hypothetical protein ACK2T7_00475 [Anaerolineales bacterium]
MTDYPLKREPILENLTTTFKDKDYALAMYEGGAAGFDRVDQWSDLDVQVIVKDESVEQAFTDLEDTLAALSEIDYKYRLPEPTWHGHSQAFYRLKDASPFLMLDIVFIRESSEADRFMQFRTHGRPNVLFDKPGLIVEEPLDEPAMIEAMKAAVEAKKMYFDLYWVLTEKEIQRKNEIEAFHSYYSFAVLSLQEMLRIIYSPVRHFYRRYPQYDLPPEVTKRLASFYYVSDLDALKDKFDEARAWFAELVESLDWDEVARKLAES